MLICILTKNVITSCSVTMMLFLHLEVKPLMTLTTVLYLSCALLSGHLFFSSRRRHTRLQGDWSSDVCSSDLAFVGTISGIPSPLLELPVIAPQGFGPAGGQVWIVNEREAGTGDNKIYAVSPALTRSEERRVGKECRSRWSPDH